MQGTELRKRLWVAGALFLPVLPYLCGAVSALREALRFPPLTSFTALLIKELEEVLGNDILAPKALS